MNYIPPILPLVYYSKIIERRARVEAIRRKETEGMRRELKNSGYSLEVIDNHLRGDPLNPLKVAYCLFLGVMDGDFFPNSADGRRVYRQVMDFCRANGLESSLRQVEEDFFYSTASPFKIFATEVVAGLIETCVVVSSLGAIISSPGEYWMIGKAVKRHARKILG